jgi:hypothetical protein
MVAARLSEETLSALERKTDATGNTVVKHAADDVQPVATED